MWKANNTARDACRDTSRQVEQFYTNAFIVHVQLLSLPIYSLVIPIRFRFYDRSIFFSFKLLLRVITCVSLNINFDDVYQMLYSLYLSIYSFKLLILSNNSTTINHSSLIFNTCIIVEISNTRSFMSTIIFQ